MKTNKMLAEIVETAFGFCEDSLKVLLRFATLLSRVNYERIATDLDAFFRKYESVRTEFSGLKVIIPSLEPINLKILSTVDLLAKNGIRVSEGYTEFINTMFPHGLFLVENSTEQTSINVYKAISTFTEYQACQEIGGQKNCILSLSQVIYLMKNFNISDSEQNNEIFQKYRCSIFFVRNQKGEIVSFTAEPLGDSWRLRTRLFNQGPGWMGDQFLYSRV